MTYEEWLVEECGTNHGWSFSEVDAGKRAWDASRREALSTCTLRSKQMEYDDYSEANYWFAIFSFIDLIKRYGEDKVMHDLGDTLDRLEAQEGEEVPF